MPSCLIVGGASPSRLLCDAKFALLAFRKVCSGQPRYHGDEAVGVLLEALTFEAKNLTSSSSVPIDPVFRPNVSAACMMLGRFAVCAIFIGEVNLAFGEVADKNIKQSPK